MGNISFTVLLTCHLAICSGDYTSRAFTLPISYNAHPLNLFVGIMVCQRQIKGFIPFFLALN